MPSLARHSPASLLLVLGALVFASCGDESDGVFDLEGFAITFEYPDDFAETTDVEIDQTLGNDAGQNAAVALDEDNLLLVQRFELTIEVDDANLGKVKAELERLIQEVDPSVSLTPTQIAGLPALTGADQVPVPSVDDGESRITFIFDGDQEYVLNCQSTPDKRTEIAEACDLALDTLTLK